MFDHLRAAFKEAVENFKEELNREDDPGTVDRLLVGMEGEVAQAHARLRTLHAQVEEARAEAAREAAEEATCRRRAEMARRVGDEETARIAAEYAGRHARRREVLERKAAALREEQELRASEVAEMLAHLRTAKDERESMERPPVDYDARLAELKRRMGHRP